RKARVGNRVVVPGRRVALRERPELRRRRIGEHLRGASVLEHHEDHVREPWRLRRLFGQLGRRSVGAGAPRGEGDARERDRKAPAGRRARAEQGAAKGTWPMFTPCSRTSWTMGTCVCCWSKTSRGWRR